MTRRMDTQRGMNRLNDINYVSPHTLYVSGIKSSNPTTYVLVQKKNNNINYLYKKYKI